MSGSKEHVERHKDGSVRARGQTVAGLAHGYWEFFRRDGTRLRTGHFEHGAQTGEWVTYDRNGHPYKTTIMKPGASKTLTRL